MLLVVASLNSIHNRYSSWEEVNPNSLYWLLNTDTLNLEQVSGTYLITHMDSDLDLANVIQEKSGGYSIDSINIFSNIAIMSRPAVISMLSGSVIFTPVLGELPVEIGRIGKLIFNSGKVVQLTTLKDNGYVEVYCNQEEIIRFKMGASYNGIGVGYIYRLKDYLILRLVIRCASEDGRQPHQSFRVVAIALSLSGDIIDVLPDEELSANVKYMSKDKAFSTKYAVLSRSKF